MSVKNVNYTVSGKKILDDVSFVVDEGDTIALLGDNGAGKTSLFEVLADIVKPDSGHVLFFNSFSDSFSDGMSFGKCKTEIGVLWDDIALFPWLRVKEVIRYVAAMHGIGHYRIDSYDQLNIKAIENSFMRKLSKGEHRKVELLLATMHDPDFLILDEPTSSLDRITRDYVWNNMILKKGGTVLFSTHQWEEAEKYANKILFIHNGKLLNEPASSVSLIERTRLKYRVSVHNSIRIDDVSAFSYESESNVNYLVAEDDDASLNGIKSGTMYFSIAPVTLTDIYKYLTTTAK